MNESQALKLKHKDKGYEVRDEIVRGLVLRVGKKAPKVWEVVVQQGKKRRRQRLGTFPALSVKDARKNAEAAKESARTFTMVDGPKTVEDIFEAYKTARQSQMRTWHDVQSVWDNWAMERIGHVRATDLTIHHGLDLRAHISAKSSPLRAGSVIRYLRPMFAWAADEQLIDDNPWARLKVGVSATSRDRVLSVGEWNAVWQATYDQQYPLGPFSRVLMLSAQRISNVAQMRWDEIHGDVWTIPREKVKSTRPESAAAHEVPLSRALAEIISEQPRLGPYVFTTKGDRPISPGSKLKKRLQLASETSDWRFHDLRRTAATLMTTGKVLRFIVERVLGHTDSSVTAVYDRATYRDEKREALEVLSATALPPKSDDEAMRGVKRL
ncbi:site-specific integrase [uncultured Roseovarius sp.]|uniref:tyrosine-type recombinase/integrase n=1 Tax=uncultured Roseovarius sp. TaxID=293344 RepID=UPI0026318473|nr:site-specific integrase [uncultured Roseovarius sp.]